MKQLHRPDLYAWSAFNPDRNIDFHSVLWVRESGNVIIDPLPLGPHDQKHLKELGGADLIIVTNSDHVRDTERVQRLTGARVAGPAAEQADFPVRCDHWLGEGDKPMPGLVVLEMRGSKTPGELALLLERTTLITGDLIRCHAGGTLRLLPDEKLTSKTDAVESVRRLTSFREIAAVIPLDGWPVFRQGRAALKEIGIR